MTSSTTTSQIDLSHVDELNHGFATRLVDHVIQEVEACYPADLYPDVVDRRYAALLAIGDAIRRAGLQAGQQAEER